MTSLLHTPLLWLGFGVGASLLCLLLAFADGGGRKQAQRVDRLRARHDKGGSRGAELKLRREGADQRPLDQMMRRFVPRPELLRERLRRTGRPIGMGVYGLSSLVVGAVTGLSLKLTGLSAGLVVVAGLLAGLWLPHLAIGFLIRRRAMRFTVLFPEAIGLMVRNIKSGLPITESFQIVGQEVPDPVGAEFRQISDQIRLGQPVEQVLWDAARRVATPEMKFLVVTLSIQRETGGNLAETLENLDTILRRRRQMRLKVRAMSSEARASALIIGSLPFLMMGVLTVVNRAYITQLFTDPRGHLMLAAGVASLVIGFGVMAKMVRFEI